MGCAGTTYKSTDIVYTFISSYYIQWAADPTAKPQTVVFYEGAKPLGKLKVPAHSLAGSSILTP